MSSRGTWLLARRCLSSASGPTGGKVAKVKRHSGAQLEVLALYRAWLRAIRAKNVDAEQRRAMVQHVRTAFKANAVAVRPLDVDRVEKLLAKGTRQLRTFRLSSGGFEVKTIEPRDDR